MDARENDGAVRDRHDQVLHSIAEKHEIRWTNTGTRLEGRQLSIERLDTQRAAC